MPAETRTVTLDCTGMACPRPIIELARAVVLLRPGDGVKLIADDPAAQPDVAAWCRMRGHTLLVSSPPHFSVLVEATPGRPLDDET